MTHAQPPPYFHPSHPQQEPSASAGADNTMQCSGAVHKLPEDPSLNQDTQAPSPPPQLLQTQVVPQKVCLQKHRFLLMDLKSAFTQESQFQIFKLYYIEEVYKGVLKNCPFQQTNHFCHQKDRKEKPAQI